MTTFNDLWELNAFPLTYPVAGWASVQWISQLPPEIVAEYVAFMKGFRLGHGDDEWKRKVGLIDPTEHKPGDATYAA